MSEEEKPRDKDPQSWRAWALAAVLGASGLLAVTWSALWTVRQKAACTKCKGNLKIVGLCLQSYYSDGVSSALPSLKRLEVSTGNDGGFGLDANMLSCPAARQDGLMHYLWNPKLSGSTWAIWNNPDSPLIWDAAPHKVNGRLNVLMGDGHVEELTSEQLKDRTR
ncbi:MAG: hypothetical protein RL095_1927 [Verrucomicrobiota bacterium]|jgi:prepilin-type processing-associated H-X9-DG protein